MIRNIKKKLKKDAADFFSKLKPYLNLESDVDCMTVGKVYMKEYLESLIKVSTNDDRLKAHLLEIGDAYLLYRGEKI